MARAPLAAAFGRPTRDERRTSTPPSSALFDVNGNGFADFSLCISLLGNGRVVEQSALVLYSCRDSRPDRCLDAAVVGCRKGLAGYDPSGGACSNKWTLKSTFDVLSRQGPAEGDPYSCSLNHTKSSTQDTGCVNGMDAGWDQVADVCVSWSDVPKTAVMIDVCR